MKFMLFAILKTAVILLIAVPFIYMFVDVFVDLHKRSFHFYRHKAKPVVVSVLSTFSKF
ncbi:MAG: hypothetical protein ACE5HS_03990 [bacterium]